jgi:cyclophilin family peptidyl-prolyl cis-trans isomerase/HEAT repeat protein
MAMYRNDMGLTVPEAQRLHAIIRLRMHKARATCLCLAVLCGACATAPASLTTAAPVGVTWEEKLGWMMRLEDQRMLRDPNPQEPVVLVPATRTQPAVVAPRPPSDLIRLLGDTEARVRRRAALALGRVGLPEAVEPLVALLADEESDVRQMSAFALGQIGSQAARPALLAALGDPDPRVPGRAAEALGLLGDHADAAAVSDMVRTHIAAGALAGVTAEELSYPLSPAAEATRLGLYALVRFGSFDPLWAAVFDSSGRPASNWWPVAYAIQRVGDPRGGDALEGFLDTPGRYTAAFAARGLGVMKAQAAAGALRQIVERRTAQAAVVIEAVRALALMNDAAASPLLTAIVANRDVDPALRHEAMMALSALATDESIDVMLDLMSDSAPAVRGAARRALARMDPDTFMAALSGLDMDPIWTVRADEAAALALLPPARAQAKMQLLLNDEDHRVVAAALRALVTSKAPGAEATLIEHLKAGDFAVRAAAAGGLAELKAPAAVPHLVEAYRASLADTTYVARAAVLAALAAIDQAAARPLLDEGLRDADWAVRVRAAELVQERDAEAIRPAPSRELPDAEWQALVSPAFSPHAYIETDRGIIEIELAILDAPWTVANFMSLARRNFFNGLTIHRVVPNFVVQAGDDRGDGEGGPGYTIRDEINMRPYLRGTVGMARDWEDTGGSQFFITHSPQPHLDGRYTVFGHVVAGMDVVDQLAPGDRIRRVRIWDGVTPE